MNVIVYIYYLTFLCFCLIGDFARGITYTPNQIVKLFCYIITYGELLLSPA